MREKQSSGVVCKKQNTKHSLEKLYHTSCGFSGFKALADPTRRLLLQHLCEEGSGIAASFATRLPITRQAIIKHLVTLEQAGLVTAHKMGRERRYVPRPEALSTVTTWIGEISAQWDQCLAVLK